MVIPFFGLTQSLSHCPVFGDHLTGKPPWNFITMEEVNKDIEVFRKIKPGIVSLSAHDSCDASIDAFRKAYPSAYRDVRVGKNLVIGHYVSSFGILNNAKGL